MQIKQFHLRHFRLYDDATFSFVPGMNLIVGVNGSGKSTILDALRTVLVQAIPRLTNIKMRSKSFSVNDIMNNKESLTVDVQFEHAGQTIVYLVHQPNEKYRSLEDNQQNQVYGLTPRRDLAYLDEYGIQHHINSIRDVPVSIKSASHRPLAVYYSTRRSLLKESKGSQRERAVSLAYAESLRIRELNVQEFSDWWLIQEEDGRNHVLDSLRIAISTFLDDVSNIRVVRELDRTLALDRSGSSLLLDKAGMPLDVRQLSDGERGVLTLVLDLARRLVLANPDLSDPLRQGQAVVLIDELDLHLHPQWQRTIVQKLTETFPQCQFIATTHSPIIIGEVQPQALTLLSQKAGKIEVIQHGLQAYGLDVSYILETLMDTSSRSEPSRRQIELVEDALEEGDLELARTHLKVLRILIHGNDNEVVRLEASMNNLEALADEMDTEEERAAVPD